MSWGVQAVGKAPAVAAEIERQFAAQTPCAEPEETVRQAARAAIAASLAGCTSQNATVKVSASGSQAQRFDSAAGKYVEGEFTNTLSLAIEQLHGFVE